MLFDFDDILIIPERMSDISSRKEVNIYDENSFLPLFTAPMDTVVNEDNFVNFFENKIYSIIPRGLNKSMHSWDMNKWYSYGLDEFEKHFLLNERFNPEGYPYPTPSSFQESNLKFYALIDVANGHMKRLYDLAKRAKEKYKDKLVLMVGNVANPETYKEYAKIGVDYVRLGIGNGAGCLTTQQTGIGYPMASLIHGTAKIKAINGFNAKIVADGGFKKFADIIKALALGADYVMLGSMFNKALESIGEMFVYYKENNLSEVQYIPIEQYKNITQGYSKDKPRKTDLELFEEGYPLYKKYRGMSTKEVQQAWGKKELKTAEGISKIQKVEYTLSGWCENFKHYLSSAMSYTGSYNLEEFKNSHFELITQNSFNRFNK